MAVNRNSDMSWICVDHFRIFGVCDKACKSDKVVDPYLFTDFVAERRRRLADADQKRLVAMKEHEADVREIDTEFLMKVLGAAVPREKVFGRVN